MAEAMQQVMKLKPVAVAEAKRLALYVDEIGGFGGKGGQKQPDPDTVEIPQWRHAMISFPHPLLKQGLVILDTPGLNALGSEPELTLNMLPNAQAVLFVLAADTGVTRSDLDMWQNHIRSCRGDSGVGLVAALNKIDTLWDEIKSQEQIDATIESQCKETARMLGIEPASVFPVSAQKGLLAKIRQDSELLTRSRLPLLEHFLSDNVVPAKQAIVNSSVIEKAGAIIEDTRNTLIVRIQGVQKQLDELRGLDSTNADVLQHLVRKTRDKQAAFNKKTEHFQSSRRVLAQQAKVIMDALNLTVFDRMIAASRKDMEGSWSTGGLKKGMQVFFDNMRDTMHVVARQAEQTYSVVQTIYAKFQEDGAPLGATPEMFSVDKYTNEFDRLYEEAEKFRNSPVTTMTEQSFVVKKFFISLGSHARVIVSKANQDVDNWLKEIMQPLIKQVNESKQQLERQLETLNKINDSKDTLETKLKEIEGRHAALEVQLKDLNAIDKMLRTPVAAA